LFSKLGLKTLIKAQNVSELDLVCCWNIFSKKLPKN
jgi:hypothetical protein